MDQGPVVFTGIPEVDEKILFELDYSTLIDVCSTNQYMYSICQSDGFWKTKVLIDYGPEVVSVKPPDETYQDQYTRLYNMYLEDAFQKGYLDVIIANFNGIEDLPEYYLTWAILSDDVNILNWLAQHGAVFNADDFSNAVTNEKLQSLKWLLQQGYRPEYVNETDEMIGYSDAELREIVYQLDLDFTKDSVEHAIYHNNVGALNWLESQDIDITNELSIPMGPEDENAMECALINGNINVLEWLAQHDVWPTEEDLSSFLIEYLIAQENDLQDSIETMGLTLEWLDQHNISPSEKLYAIAQEYL